MLRLGGCDRAAHELLPGWHDAAVDCGRGGCLLAGRVAKQGQKLIDKGAKSARPKEPEQAAQVTAYGSGNLGLTAVP